MSWLGDIFGDVFDLWDDSEKKGLAAQQQAYQDSVSGYKPYTDAGTKSLGTLMDLLGLGEGGSGQAALNTLENSPQYQFGAKQGMKSLNSRLANAGAFNSGAATKAATRYATDYASGQVNKLANELAQLAGMGESAQGALSNLNTEWGDDQAGYWSESGNDWGSLVSNVGNGISSGYDWLTGDDDDEYKEYEQWKKNYNRYNS